MDLKENPLNVFIDDIGVKITKIDIDNNNKIVLEYSVYKKDNDDNFEEKMINLDKKIYHFMEEFCKLAFNKR